MYLKALTQKMEHREFIRSSALALFLYTVINNLFYTLLNAGIFFETCRQTLRYNKSLPIFIYY